MILHRPLALLACCSFVSLVAACGGASTPEPAAKADGPAPVDAPPAVEAPSTERREMTTEDCAAKGGNVVGDIGDGAIHRPEYRCPSGSPPIGRIALGVEGSVCCT